MFREAARNRYGFKKATDEPEGEATVKERRSSGIMSV